MLILDESEELSKRVRAEAINSASAKYPGLASQNAMEFVKKCADELVEKQLDAFPEYCDIARKDNWAQWEALKQIGKKGKYTNSIGWSEDGNFKFDFSIPKGLYWFMLNMVFKGFWDEANEKVWRKFMNRVCAGEDPYDLLRWVKSIYGPSSQSGILLN